LRLCVIIDNNIKPEGTAMTENEIGKHIVDCAIEVHRTLGGPGLLESVYEEALAWELQQRGLHVERQLTVPITYKGHQLATPLRLDMLVEKRVIVENKARRPTTQSLKLKH
jgi:GxxExxY protein